MVLDPSPPPVVSSRIFVSVQRLSRLHKRETERGRLRERARKREREKKRERGKKRERLLYDINPSEKHEEERWGAGVEYHFQEFNEPYAPS